MTYRVSGDGLSFRVEGKVIELFADGKDLVIHYYTSRGCSTSTRIDCRDTNEEQTRWVVKQALMFLKKVMGSVPFYAQFVSTVKRLVKKHWQSNFILSHYGV